MHLSRFIKCDFLDFQDHLPDGFDFSKLVIYAHLIPTQLAKADLKALLADSMALGAKLVTVNYHPPAPSKGDVDDDGDKSIWIPKGTGEPLNVHLYHM